MKYNHSSQVRSYLDHITEKDPDIFLISEEGESVGTHRIVLRLFSSVLSDIITQPEPASHISVPASASVLQHLVRTLTTGVAVTRDQVELKIVAEVADTLGLGYIDWQVGVERKKKRKEVKEVEKYDESLNGFVFDQQNKEEEVSLQEKVRVDKTPLATTGQSFKDPISCDACKDKFTSKKNLRKHKGLVHGEALLKAKLGKVSKEGGLMCGICEKTFTTKKGRRRHIKTFHEEKTKTETREICSECNKSHGFKPDNDKHYECDQCNNKFYGYKVYQRHRSATHGIRMRLAKTYIVDNPNHCHDCKLACTSKTELIYHQDTRHVEGTPELLSCRFCERKIKRKQMGFFMEHIRTHTDERPEVCSYCGNSFKHKKAHKNHERLHTGEKPYKCEFCFSAFTQRSGLSSHQKSRSGCQPE